MTESTDSKRLEGRVAQIVNARELAINIGASSGVHPGMFFAVLAESPIEVIDPDTKTLLDVIDREKVRVKATEVRDKITICRTYRKILTGGGLLFPFPLVDLTSPPKEVYETLRAEDASYPPALSPEESYVKIRDRVIQVTDD